MIKTMDGRYVKPAAVLLWSVIFTLLFMPNILFAQSIVDEWQSVKTPPAPELKEVMLDPGTTALLLLDFNKQTCNEKARPRCVRSIPAVANLLKKVRDNGGKVIYSLSAGATAADIPKELSPVGDEPAVTSGPDKFLGTDLEKIIKEKGIKTVIVTGTAAHGAVLYTASGAALRGTQVVVAVDGISAENPYAEQYTVWHLKNAPRVSNQVTLTRTTSIKF